MNQIELKGQYSDFIGQYESILDFDFCDSVIESFNYLHDVGAVFCNDSAPDSNVTRFDWCLSLENVQQHLKKGGSVSYVNEILKESLDEYRRVFGVLSNEALLSSSMKVQKTPAGGGYHTWHCENYDAMYTDRKLVWMFYLNDDFEGGETEFLYYKKRIKPSKGTLLIWPAGFTHTHRGGLVLKNTKYVITGWFNLLDAEYVQRRI